MDTISDTEIEEIVNVYLEYGEDFHEGIEEVAQKENIHSGIILSGIATFDEAQIHHITDTEFPPNDEFVTLEGPIELCSVDGIIADYEPHMHCTMAVRGNELFSGHLEPGCNVLYLAEVAIAKLKGKPLKRETHPQYKTPRLKRQQ